MRLKRPHRRWRPTPEVGRGATPVAAAAPPAIAYRKPVSSRAQAEEAELRRRLDWLEQHTPGEPVDMEAVITGMKLELQGISALSFLARERESILARDRRLGRAV